MPLTLATSLGDIDHLGVSRGSRLQVTRTSTEWDRWTPGSAWVAQVVKGWGDDEEAVHQAYGRTPDDALVELALAIASKEIPTD